MGNVKILNASAGSGKTFSLSYEYVRSVIEEPSLYKHILAVTFTNKATEEMKTRILSEIDRLARGEQTVMRDRLRRDLALDDEEIGRRAMRVRGFILHDYSHFAVLTIDKFFQRVIRSFLRELGLEINYNLELHTESLLSGAADALLDSVTDDAELRERLVGFMRERIEQNKRWNLKEMLLSLGQQVFSDGYRKAEPMLAKGAEIVERFRSLLNRADAIREQMRSEAKEALRLIAEQGLAPSDFKQGKNSFASYFVKVAQTGQSPYAKRVSNARVDDTEWYAKNSPHIEKIRSLMPQIRPLLDSICNTYDRNISFLNSVELLRRNFHAFTLLGDLRRWTEQLCAEQNLLPISETNHILAQLVADNDTPFIFEKVGNYYARFMIDEFQDTSTLQWNNFIPLLDNALAGEEGHPVLLVGDVKQSIYRWRGGDWQILGSRVEQDFGTDRVDRFRLATNYRSMRRIVEFNNALIGRIVELDNLQLDTALDAAVGRGELHPEVRDALRGSLAKAYADYEQSAADRTERGYVEVSFADRQDEEEMSRYVIARVEELQKRGYRPGDIAVLVRTNREGRTIAAKLLDRKNSSPDSKYCYDVVTQEALTVASGPVVGFVTACLRLALDLGDSIHRAVYNRWLGRAFDDELSGEEREFFLSLALLSPEEAFERIVMRFALQELSDQVAYLQALHQQIVTFSSSTVADIELFLKWWDEKGATASLAMQPTEKAITVSTIHKVKGLQYKVVILPNLSWRLQPQDRELIWTECSDPELGIDGNVLLPFSKTKMSNSAFADACYREQVFSHIDAINMLYVALTRAEEELHLLVPVEAERKESQPVGLLIAGLLGVEGDVQFGDLTGVRRADGSICFGEPMHPVAERVQEEGYLQSYPTSPVGMKVRLRLPSERYFDTDAPAELSPRNYGILMHRVFAEASSAEQVREAIARMELDSLLTAGEAERLRERVERAFADPVIRSWFEYPWDRVRNESSIVLPGDDPMRRPDRVMIAGDRAVVVDYKFGRNEKPEYARQLQDYMELLTEMGYASVEGYLWYVMLDRVVPVEAAG